MAHSKCESKCDHDVELLAVGHLNLVPLPLVCLFVITWAYILTDWTIILRGDDVDGVPP